MARKVAERCQRQLQKKSIVHALSPHGRRVTVSVGASTVVPDDQHARGSLIKAADQQLYLAKNNGRNRVEHVQLGA
ncbi:response regulator PleD [compost metagenome]